MLVGTKVELRDRDDHLDQFISDERAKALQEDRARVEEMRSRGQSPLSFEQGVEMAKKIGAVKYLECSTVTQKVDYLRLSIF